MKTLADMTAAEQAKFIGMWIKRLTALSAEVKFDFLNPGKMDSMTSIHNRLVIGIENYGEKAYSLTEKQIAFVEDTLNDELKFLSSKKRAIEVEAARKAEAQTAAETPTTEAAAPTIWDVLDAKEKELSPIEYGKWLYPDTPLYGEGFEPFDEEAYERDMRDLQGED